MNVSQKDLMVIINFVRQHPRDNILIGVIPAQNATDDGTHYVLNYSYVLTATEPLKTEIIFY